MSSRRTTRSTQAAQERVPVRLAVLGCGRIAQSVHLPTLRSLASIETVALAEPDPSLREQARQIIPEAVAYSDWREVLKSPDVEAVLIALPNALHAEAAVAAFESKKHVYLEKPIALDLDSAKQVLDAWRSSGSIGAIGLNYRFHPLIRAMKETIHEQAIGDLLSVRTRFCTSSQTLPTWKQARQSGGGVLIDLASHHIDLIRFLFEEAIVDVTARISSLQYESDNAELDIRLANGLPVQSFFSLTADNEDSIEVVGTAGKLFFSRHQSSMLQLTGVRLPVLIKQKLRELKLLPYVLCKLRNSYYEPSFRLALNRFAECVRSGHGYSPDLSDGLSSLEVVLRAEEVAQAKCAT